MGEEQKSGLHSNDTEGTLGGAIALEKQKKKNIAHNSNVGPLPPRLCLSKLFPKSQQVQ